MRTLPRARPGLRIRRTDLLRIAAVSLLVLVAPSCAQWTHPSKDRQEYATDDAVCNREAEESGKAQYWPRYRVYEYCMADRGWYARIGREVSNRREPER